MAFDPIPMAAANDKIICRLCSPGKTGGGIDLPDGVSEDGDRWEVIAVGPGRIAFNGDRIPSAVAKGDIILVAGAKREFTHIGVQYCLFPEDAIGAYIKKK